jgi:hypothetical protein
MLREAQRTSGDEWRRRESNPRSQDSVDASRPNSDRGDSDEDESDLDPAHKLPRPEGLA